MDNRAKIESDKSQGIVCLGIMDEPIMVWVGTLNLDKIRENE